jgi:hypothetical protein
MQGFLVESDISIVNLISLIMGVRDNIAALQHGSLRVKRSPLLSVLIHHSSGIKYNGVRGLAIWHCVRSFLQPDDLPVCKFTAIVHERHCPNGSTDIPWAPSWLLDLATVDFDLNSMRACEAAEERDLHVWNHRRSVNYQAFYRDEFIGI